MPTNSTSLLVTIRGIRYNVYDFYNPKIATKGWVLLLHGFPDLAKGWQIQAEILAAEGYRVIVPDLVGFGGTEAPKDLIRYTFKSVSLDMLSLMEYFMVSEKPSGITFGRMKSLGLKIPQRKLSFYIAAHDWGGMVGWRMAQYFPNNVKGLVSFCTGFLPTNRDWIPDEILFKYLPNLSYQSYLGKPETVKYLERNLDIFFDAMMFEESSAELLTEETLKKHPIIAQFKGPSLSKKIDTTAHKETYRKTGFEGPLNWYKTRKLNYFQEVKDLQEQKMTKGISKAIPCMLILGANDPYLPPSMSKNMKKLVPHCDVVKLEDCGHWLLMEKGVECAQLLLTFLSRSEGRGGDTHQQLKLSSRL